MLDGLYDLCWTWWCNKVSFPSYILIKYHAFILVDDHLSHCISTRVSNELGAGHPQGARLALCVMIIIALSEGTVVGISTILVRREWGKLYSNEEEVIKYVANMMPLLALSDFLDGFQCVLSGPNFLSQVKWDFG